MVEALILHLQGLDHWHQLKALLKNVGPYLMHKMLRQEQMLGTKGKRALNLAHFPGKSWWCHLEKISGKKPTAKKRAFFIIQSNGYIVMWVNNLEYMVLTTALYSTSIRSQFSMLGHTTGIFSRSGASHTPSLPDFTPFHSTFWPTSTSTTFGLVSWSAL